MDFIASIEDEVNSTDSVDVNSVKTDSNEVENAEDKTDSNEVEKPEDKTNTEAKEKPEDKTNSKEEEKPEDKSNSQEEEKLFEEGKKETEEEIEPEAKLVKISLSRLCKQKEDGPALELLFRLFSFNDDNDRLTEVKTGDILSCEGMSMLVLGFGIVNSEGSKLFSRNTYVRIVVFSFVFVHCFLILNVLYRFIASI